ncbi:MAG: hypothetical protein C4K47_04285 [Candidatus Thorarchaeota archaeon]|nr:MAG: hypothetical protein C4K47_04285 [Candidatus Thorarchaeota archaeon]
MGGIPVQAQASAEPTSADFPIGLLLEYDVFDSASGTSAASSQVKYEVLSWLKEQEIVEIEYSDDNVQYVKLPSWSIVDSNGTEAGAFMDPLWMDTATLGEGQGRIPPANPMAPVYDTATAVVNVPVGTFTCWRCQTIWTQSDYDVQRDFYYESALGVLVCVSESHGPSLHAYPEAYWSWSTTVLGQSNIQSFMSSEKSEDPDLPPLNTILWFLISVSVIAIPVVVMVRLKP